MPPSGDEAVGGRRRAVFFDRDGVLIRADVRDGRPHAIKTFAELEYLPGAHRAIALARENGFLTVVVTNQPDVARGDTDRAEVDAMHADISRVLGVDDIQACFEVESPESRRYKPRPGMLLDAACQHDIDLGKSYMVGDRWRDIDAGRAAGCFSIFIDCGYNEELRQPPDAIVPDVLAAVEMIIAREAVQERRGV